MEPVGWGINSVGKSPPVPSGPLPREGWAEGVPTSLSPGGLLVLWAHTCSLEEKERFGEGGLCRSRFLRRFTHCGHRKVFFVKHILRRLWTEPVMTSIGADPWLMTSRICLTTGIRSAGNAKHLLFSSKKISPVAFLKVKTTLDTLWTHRWT